MTEAKNKKITITNIDKIINKRISNTEWVITNAYETKINNTEDVYVFLLKVITTNAILPKNKSGVVTLKRDIEYKRSGGRVKFVLNMGYSHDRSFGMERTYDTAIKGIATIEDFVRELEDCIFNFTLFTP